MFWLRKILCQPDISHIELNPMVALLYQDDQEIYSAFWFRKVCHKKHICLTFKIE